ncbi:hypothetical protein T4D_17162 [Trichinella pseudospiralis]|uniref:Uncharacterized protein n=1 Tax=Trichinella pseudospiralis TaxID=6337 RepID=A0A0V1F9E0_TRIPS|nr:hypothetical protein T4D_17162 [Trichinella pseudospiralis]
MAYNIRVEWKVISFTDISIKTVLITAATSSSTRAILVGSFGMLVEMILLPSIRQYQRGKQKTLACLLDWLIG